MKLAKWYELPKLTREHLDERIARIPKGELQKLAFWVATNPNVPDGRWYKDFGTFKVCGVGRVTTTFLDAQMHASGEKVE